MNPYNITPNLTQRGKNAAKWQVTGPYQRPLVSTNDPQFAATQAKFANQHARGSNQDSRGFRNNDHPFRFGG